MEKVELGKTGLYIHPVGLGANKIAKEDNESNTQYGGEVLSTAIENGLNFIDTAFIYGNGVSEEIIGKTIKENNWRGKVVIATKGAHRISGDTIEIDNSPKFLNKTVDDSLKRLQTDVIDLFYIHFPDETTPKYEAVGALKRLKDEGKIRSIGVSNFSLKQLKEANYDGYVDVVQGEYNLIDRSAETEFFTYFKDNQISFIPYYPLASGLLSAKYNRNSVISEKNKKRSQFQGDNYLRNIEKVEQIRDIANKHSLNIPHIVLAYYLSKDNIDCVIPGSRNTNQVLDNLKTLDVKLTTEDILAIEKVFPL